MRAVWVGLVGVALSASAVGAAEKACRLDGTELVAEAAGPAEMKRPDLAGQHFRVQRVASWTKRVPGRDPSETLTVAEISVAVEGKAGRYVISQGYTPHSVPWIMATSWAPKDAKSVNLAGAEDVQVVDWSKRSRKAEASYFTEEIASFNVYGGPFSGMSLSPTHCR
ncbi:hypothetical protein [Methylobacterium nigriterrae]|uniref:hypothetical protein n=1 Tax=Methylobacterium nigriterrae TaxID=3127512 RepID=UPI0030137B79